MSKEKSVMAEIRAGRPSFRNNDPDKIALNEPTSGPQSQSHPSGVVIPPINNPIGIGIGIGIGGSDLFPGPGRGDFGGSSGGGGMLLGPNDPRWFGGVGGGAQPAGVPPGARFDPYGPPSVPGFEPNRFLRNPKRRPARRANHPELHHFGSGSD